MSDYLITGKKGNGKTIFAVGVIRDALIANKKVVTNLDVNLNKFGNVYSTKTICRIPDCPTRSDLDFIGRGQDGVNEDDNGILILDEVSKFMNSRTWGDKSRNGVLDWLVHSRKMGWDVYMIAQGPEQIDKQLRSTLLEYWITVKRTDKWPIPILTPLVKMLTGFRLGFPKMHIGTIRHGFDRDSIVVDRKFYTGAPLYSAYDTRQIFHDNESPNACGVSTTLSAWTTTGRYLPKKLTILETAFHVLGYCFASVTWVLCLLFPSFEKFYVANRFGF